MLCAAEYAECCLIKYMKGRGKNILVYNKDIWENGSITAPFLTQFYKELNV
jgi:hypothetical protein